VTDISGDLTRLASFTAECAAAIRQKYVLTEGHERTSDTVSREIELHQHDRRGNRRSHHRRAAAMLNAAITHLTMTEGLGRLSSNVSPREASLKGRSV
jgi:hypothetical protein